MTSPIHGVSIQPAGTVLIYDSSISGYRAATGTESGAIKIAGNLVPEDYDFIELGYTGANLTSVIYKSGGSLGTTVATLTLTYDGSDNLETITRT